MRWYKIGRFEWKFMSGPRWFKLKRGRDMGQLVLWPLIVHWLRDPTPKDRSE